ncbi:alpha/beta fold hydrolase [Nocardioides kongjuensis]|uniref:Pimeloyl-ACP methyl ester carboxylesterase n=1 Tax=Nocardioides kongjuensis TaxID=349522 RepID=A0A852R3I4_9ACTN|nr:pimeloyl-ACP methyl ester carboxylesterase [Nocardioides kongjuensis]
MSLGSSGAQVVFCHGLFGQGRNWTQHARDLATDHRVVLVDMPNHGSSPWTDNMDYMAIAEQLAATLRSKGPSVVVGHSMGAKVAMILALRFPELVERLCVVDMSPATYRDDSSFRAHIDAMMAIDLPHEASRADADTLLRAAVPDDPVRSFLLQSLRRTPHGWRWQLNLEVLRDELPAIMGWPTEAIAGLRSYAGPVLWVAGKNSNYVTEEHQVAMQTLFPAVRTVVIPGAGHWVHAEQPLAFRDHLRAFLAGSPE